MDKAKEIIPNECRIGDTYFKSLATIGGNLYKRHPKNLNHVHKDSKDLLSVIIILGTDIHGDETVFLNGEKMNDIGKRAHVLKHSHGRCVIGSFDKFYMYALFGLVIELLYHLSSTNQYFFTFCIMAQNVMTSIYQKIG